MSECRMEGKETKPGGCGFKCPVVLARGRPQIARTVQIEGYAAGWRYPIS